MDTENKKPGRRKFIAWSIASAALLAVAKFISPAKPEKKTVKMLTEEGKLVEVDIAAIPPEKKKITNRELQNWIKK